MLHAERTIQKEFLGFHSFPASKTLDVALIPLYSYCFQVFSGGGGVELKPGSSSMLAATKIVLEAPK